MGAGTSGGSGSGGGGSGSGGQSGRGGRGDGGSRGADARGPLLIDFANEFCKDLDGVCGADGFKLRNDPIAAAKALRTLCRVNKRCNRDELAKWVHRKTQQRECGRDLQTYSAFLHAYQRLDAAGTSGAEVNGGGSGGAGEISRGGSGEGSSAVGPGGHPALTAVELPGQYSGDRPPEPSTHVFIECLDPQVLVMRSLRMPKRITIQGTDQREYKFLCKG